LKGLYYFTKKPYQFSQSKPVFNRLGGTIITYTKYPRTFFYFLIRYGPFRVRLAGKKFKHLAKSISGIVLCHSGEYIVPYGKNYKRVFVYHGTCDTVYKADGPDDKLLSDWFEYYFVTGDKDLYKLKKYTYDSEKLDGKIIKTGMFRSDPIFNREYEREKIIKRYRIKDNGKRIVLYAPTWQWGGGTLGHCFEEFACSIPDKYIFIVRPHVNDTRNIEYIIRWQKKNRKRDLYIFPCASQDIMDFIHIADLLIGDNSAVNYDFALTKKPIVLIKSKDHENLFIPPDEFNIKLCCPLFTPGKDDIMEKINEAFHNAAYIKCIESLVEKSFYFNDGHTVDRICSFIVDELSDMGIVNRERILKKYGMRFVYRDDYRVC